MHHKNMSVPNWSFNLPFDTSCCFPSPNSQLYYRTMIMIGTVHSLVVALRYFILREAAVDLFEPRIDEVL